MSDLRYALRTLSKTPRFTLFTILTLALGIGANSAIFSVVDAVLLKPLPYRDSDRLVWVWATRKDVSRAFYSIPNFTDTREQNQTLEKLIAFGIWGVNFSGQGETERLQGIRISSHAFQTLGVEPSVGRALQPDDDNADAARVVMLSHGLWQRRFGGDPRVIGRTLNLNGDLYTVVGILPRHFIIPNAEIEVVTPLRIESDPRRAERGSNFLRLMARLKPGVTVPQAQMDLAAITDRLRQQYPDDNGNLTAPRVLPLQGEMVGGYRQGLFVLFGAVAVVLLIACSNLANLQLARAAARHREVAIRTALGANRWDLLRQLLTEGMVLGVSGGLLGCLLAVWGKDFLVSLAPGNLPRAGNIAINAPVLVFCAVLSLVVGTVLGLAPALETLKSSLNLDLKQGGRGSTGGSGRMRNALIVSEIALSLVLLVAAGLILKSFARLRNVEPGFATEHTLVVRFSLPPAKYGSGQSVRLFYDKMAPRVAELHGVSAIAAASALPMSGLNARTEFVVSGRPPAKPNEVPAAQHRWVSPGYFHALQIPILRGRDFRESDTDTGNGVVVVDQALARRFFANQEPIGAHIFITMGDGLPANEYEIVGIADNVKHNELNEEPIPTFYGPIPQAPKSAVPFLANNFSMLVRSSIDSQTMASAVRAELRKVDADVAVSSVKPTEELLAASVASRKFNLVLLATFAGTALLLAASGLYTVIAYLVSQRTAEIGVRLALGAQRSDVLSLILGHGFRLVAAGVALGIVGATAISGVLRNLLFSTSPTDPVTYGGVALLLGIVAGFASYLPARRAMNVDPIVALRYE